MLQVRPSRRAARVTLPAASNSPLRTMEAAAHSTALHHILQHRLMRAMDAIEVADAEDSRAGGDVFEFAKDLHQISNSSFRPSCASWMFSGKAALVSSCGRSCEM